MDLYKTSAAAEVTVSEAPVEKAPKKAAKTVKVAKKEASLPEATEGAPGAEEYRLSASEIDSAVCVAREFDGEDKRWKPIIFRESQCGGVLTPGSDLCSKCSKRAEKYAMEPKPGAWKGRVTEEPLGWIHMLGTEWALEKKPRFVSSSVSSASSSAASVASEVADASDSESESVSSQTEMPATSASATASVAAPVSDKKAAAAAAKAQKLADKEAAAAAKLAEKEAAAAKKLADKEAAAAKKLADAAAKKAEKAEKAAKPVKKAEAKVSATSASASASNSAASEVTEVTEVTGELKLIDGTLYMVKTGNVYEYDELSEKAGDFVGRFTADETIDTEADEVAAAESDSE
jgi:hypothetical protein